MDEFSCDQSDIMDVESDDYKNEIKKKEEFSSFLDNLSLEKQ